MQEKLMIIRKRKKMTQEEVAAAIGISVRQYGLKERGVYEFTSDEMFAIRDLFGMSMDQIFLPRSHQNGDGNKVENK